MKKFIFLSFLFYHSCRTIVDYIEPTEDIIKNNFSSNITIKSYKNGAIKDSILLMSNQEFLILENKDGYRQSQLYKLDSISIIFFDGKTKTDIYCPLLFAKKDTVAGYKCTSDVVNIFNFSRTKQIYDKTTRLSKFVYAVDTVDYREAR
jgi:hypothetical protein